MDGIGGRPGWAWIFIIEGVATVAVGVVCWWMVFDWPDTARFLSPDDRIRMRRRLAIDGLRNANEQYDKRHIYAAAKDWKCWGYALIYMGCLCPLYAFSLFLPTILAGMGYSGTRAQLLSVPPYACAATLTIIIGWIGDKTKKRGLLNMIIVCIGIVGFCMLIGSGNPRIQYAGTFLVSREQAEFIHLVDELTLDLQGAMGIYPTIPNALTWCSNNVEGVYKRGVIVGTVVGWGNLNGKYWRHLSSPPILTASHRHRLLQHLPPRRGAALLDGPRRRARLPNRLPARRQHPHALHAEAREQEAAVGREGQHAAGEVGGGDLDHGRQSAGLHLHDVEGREGKSHLRSRKQAPERDRGVGRGRVFG